MPHEAASDLPVLVIQEREEVSDLLASVGEESPCDGAASSRLIHFTDSWRSDSMSPLVISMMLPE